MHKTILEQIRVAATLGGSVTRTEVPETLVNARAITEKYGVLPCVFASHMLSAAVQWRDSPELQYKFVEEACRLIRAEGIALETVVQAAQDLGRAAVTDVYLGQMPA